MTVLAIKAVNKDIKRKRKLYRQSCSSYFETFWLSSHCKRKKACLLIINWHIRVASQVAKQLKTGN